MTMRKANSRTFQRRLYGPILETVICLKRGDDLQESVVTSHRLFECRWSKIEKHGQPIQGDMSSEHFRWLHVPKVEMDRVRIAYFNVLDRFIDIENRYWEPESGQGIISKLMEQHFCLLCRRLDAVSPWLGRSYS